MRLAAVLVIAASALAFLPAASSAAATNDVNDADAQIQKIKDDLARLRAERAQLDGQGDVNADAGIAQDVAKDDAAEVKAAGQLPPDEYYRGKVLSLRTQTVDAGGVNANVTTYRVRLLDGADKGKELDVQESDLDASAASRVIREGDTVALVKNYQPDGPHYYVADNYRIPSLLWMLGIFFACAVVFGRVRGLTSILGLAVTVGIIVAYVVPHIMAGADPLRTSLVGAFVIATLSLYLAHGFNKRTSIALASTLATLGISAWMAVRWVSWASLFGMGSESALFLQGSGFEHLNLRGLLLGGIMLGVLGILDDITTAQAAIVDELKHANPRFKFGELYRRGLSVGKEHIASLINTLFLAYAGVSLPLFLLFSANKGQPLWFIVNSEMISEEIVRTLVGSVCLILAVPITTALAAAFYDVHKVTDRGDDAKGAHFHHHH